MGFFAVYKLLPFNSVSLGTVFRTVKQWFRLRGGVGVFGDSWMSFPTPEALCFRSTLHIERRGVNSRTQNRDSRDSLLCLSPLPEAMRWPCCPLRQTSLPLENSLQTRESVSARVQEETSKDPRGWGRGAGRQLRLRFSPCPGNLVGHGRGPRKTRHLCNKDVEAAHGRRNVPGGPGPSSLTEQGPLEGVTRLCHCHKFLIWADNHMSSLAARQ